MGDLFPPEDRLPMYPMAPSVAYLDSAPREPGVRPWGVSRMKPYKRAHEMAVPAVASRQIDPVTQLVVCFDATGNVVDAGKHRKTYQATEKSTETSLPDGQRPGVDQDSEQELTEVD